jgi:hypothetical protein
MVIVRPESDSVSVPGLDGLDDVAAGRERTVPAGDAVPTPAVPELALGDGADGRRVGVAGAALTDALSDEGAVAVAGLATGTPRVTEREPEPAHDVAPTATPTRAKAATRRLLTTFHDRR